jgi:predicted GNAT superfamily acetyltransferase
MNAAIETSIVIRDIDARSEVHAVEELQKDVWGIPDLEVVPLAVAAVKTSGGAVGAFNGDELATLFMGLSGTNAG